MNSRQIFDPGHDLAQLLAHTVSWLREVLPTHWDASWGQVNMTGKDVKLAGIEEPLVSSMHRVVEASVTTGKRSGCSV
jgi:hypothetical protein